MAKIKCELEACTIEGSRKAPWPYKVHSVEIKICCLEFAEKPLGNVAFPLNEQVTVETHISEWRATFEVEVFEEGSRFFVFFNSNWNWWADISSIGITKTGNVQKAQKKWTGNFLFIEKVIPTLIQPLLSVEINSADSGWVLLNRLAYIHSNEWMFVWQGLDVLGIHRIDNLV